MDGDLAKAPETDRGKAPAEMLDVVDADGNPTGEVVERGTAHRLGIRHRTAHVWLVRKSRTRPGRCEILLQKRCAAKDSFPGCHDVSSAGHVPAGVDWIPSAIRELREELGVDMRPGDLHFLGKRTIFSSNVFHGKKFVNRQVSAVYWGPCDLDETAFSVDPGEVESVRWMELGELKKRMRSPSFPHCISETEIDWLLECPAVSPT